MRLDIELTNAQASSLIRLLESGQRVAELNASGASVGTQQWENETTKARLFKVIAKIISEGMHSSEVAR